MCSSKREKKRNRTFFFLSQISLDVRQNKTEDKLKHWNLFWKETEFFLCFSLNRFWTEKNLLISSSLLLLRLIKAFLILLNNFTGNISSNWTITNIFHWKFSFALSIWTNISGKSEHIVQRNLKTRKRRKKIMKNSIEIVTSAIIVNQSSRGSIAETIPKRLATRAWTAFWNSFGALISTNITGSIICHWPYSCAEKRKKKNSIGSSRKNVRQTLTNCTFSSQHKRQFIRINNVIITWTKRSSFRLNHDENFVFLPSCKRNLRPLILFPLRFPFS